MWFTTEIGIVFWHNTIGYNSLMTCQKNVGVVEAVFSAGI